MLRLQRLKIIQFRNVPPTELLFNNGFNILLGTNASGKTTLLKLIEACVRGDFSPYKEEEFEIEFDLWIDDISICSKISNKEEPYRSPEENNLEFFNDKIEIKYLKGEPFGETRNFNDQENFIRKDFFYYHFPKSGIENKLWFNLQNEFKSSIKKSKLTALIHPNAQDLLNSFYWLILANNNCLRFDESLGFYEILTKMNINESPWLKGRRIENFFDTFSSLIPDKIILPLMHPLSLQFEDMHPHPIKISISNLKSKQLNKINSIMGSSDFFVEFKEIHRKSSHQTTTIILMISDFYFKFGPREETHRTLSYGQKRLFSFIYYAACNPDIIIADELVNGLHHAWIDACMDLIKDRQCFLTSQNPLLLDCLEFESAEQVQKTFIQCKRVESENEDVQMAWSNLKPEDAQIFYSAYQRGFQHISEILITRGLW